MKPFMWQCICLIFELYKNDFLLRSSKRYESKLYSHIAQLYIMHIFLSVLSQSTVNLFPSGLNIGPIVKRRSGKTVGIAGTVGVSSTSMSTVGLNARLASYSSHVV